MAPKTKTLSFRIDDATYKWLSKLAEANGVSPSTVAQTIFRTVFQNEMRYQYKQPSAYTKENSKNADTGISSRGIRGNKGSLDKVR